MGTSGMSRKTVLGSGAALGVFALSLSAAPAQASMENTEVEWPDEFTSAYSVMAVPEEVIDSDGNQAPGEEGAMGDFMLWVNSDMDVLCYEITLTGVTGEYESPAMTATHIHEAERGEPGPPRVAFPDPEPMEDGTRVSSGCMEGPFMTGLEGDDGEDTGMGFTLDQIEANPAGFTADTHTADYLPGTVRGQLMQVPLDGVETGGGAQSSVSSTAVAAGVGGLAAAGVVGVVLMRRKQTA